jgi:hypothetical protein
MHRHGNRSDDGTEREAALFGVDRVIHLDVPDWWLLLTAPLPVSWKREAALWVALVLAGFTAGLAVGVHGMAGA